MRILTWVFVILLLLIHAVDMELTSYYIGNNWRNETFLPMSMCIKYFGIYPSIWISRVIMYTYFWIALMNGNKRGWLYFLILVTILYWLAMLPWTFQLGLLKWPLPTQLVPWY